MIRATKGFRPGFIAAAVGLDYITIIFPDTKGFCLSSNDKSPVSSLLHGVAIIDIRAAEGLSESDCFRMINEKIYSPKIIMAKIRFPGWHYQHIKIIDSCWQ